MEQVEEDLVPWLLWRLWKNINEFIYRGKDYNAFATVEKVWEDVKEWKFREGGNESVVKEPAVAQPEKKWSPPVLSRLKCNTDATWKKESGLGGMGWVLRDHHGAMLWEGVKRISAMGLVIETEA